MTRVFPTLGISLLLFSPFAVSAQQYSIDPALLQQLGVSTSTISYQLQNQLTSLIPLAQSYLQVLNPSSSDTEAIIARLQEALKDPKTLTTAQALASTTLANPENQALINTLLDQVAVLQAQIETLIAGGTATTTEAVVSPAPALPTIVSTCPSLTRPLALGSQGDDVSSLQAYLISQNLLTSDSATGYFGKLTEAAVQAWQTARAIVTSGDPATTGFGSVGPKTREALQNCTA